MGRNKRTRKGTATPTLIAKNTCIVGEVHFSGSLEIEGEVKGSIEAKGDDSDACVTIHESGAVTGQVKAPVVLVSGSVDGDIYAAKQVELTSLAVVKGSIHYTVLEVAKGAQVNAGFVQEEEHPATPPPKAEPTTPNPKVAKVASKARLEAVGNEGVKKV